MTSVEINNFQEMDVSGLKPMWSIQLNAEEMASAMHKKEIKQFANATSKCTTTGDVMVQVSKREKKRALSITCIY